LHGFTDVSLDALVVFYIFGAGVGLTRFSSLLTREWLVLSSERPNFHPEMYLARSFLCVSSLGGGDPRPR